nr:MAG TPA_asm: hypothetical protein [Bacteriophage sp.]
MVSCVLGVMKIPIASHEKRSFMLYLKIKL